MAYENCRNCGYPEGLHHYETMQCPKGGEAMPGRRQEWLGSTYMPDLSETVDRRIDRLEERIARLEKMILKTSEKISNVYYCCICGQNMVNAADGFDTCEECLNKMGNV